MHLPELSEARQDPLSRAAASGPHAANDAAATVATILRRPSSHTAARSASASSPSPALVGSRPRGATGRSSVLGEEGAQGPGDEDPAELGEGGCVGGDPSEGPPRLAGRVGGRSRGFERREGHAQAPAEHGLEAPRAPRVRECQAQARGLVSLALVSVPVPASSAPARAAEAGGPAKRGPGPATVPPKTSAARGARRRRTRAPSCGRAPRGTRGPRPSRSRHPRPRRP